MSYLVLARKYRPRTFDGLVGQEQVGRTLRNALMTGRVAHAYLFSGPRGVGKTTAARLLAMSLSCATENVADRPCGQCAACLEIQSGQAVDVIEVDGASNRGINEIRDLRETVKYLPSKGRYKVYIIDEVHALTKDAFNALLKTLEEPPAHVVFIFATTEPHKVLPTILSRCQRYDFRRIRVEDIQARLAQVAESEGFDYEPEALALLARQAEGGLRDSLSLLDQVIASTGGKLSAEAVRENLGLIDAGLVIEILDSTLNGRPETALAVLDQAYQRGYDFKEMAKKILEGIRGLTLLKVNPKSAGPLDLTEVEAEEYLRLAQPHSMATLNSHFNAWLKFQNEISRHPQPRWLMEAQVIRQSELAPLLPVTELAERLTSLLSQNPPPRPAEFRSPGSIRREVAAPMTGRASGLAPVPVSSGSLPPPKQPDHPPQETWPSFFKIYSDRLSILHRNMLAQAKAEEFSAEKVVLDFGVMPPSKVMQETLRSDLSPLLLENFSKKPDLILKGVPGSDGRSWDEIQLESWKKRPEIQALMAKLPGEFIHVAPPSAVFQAEEMPGEPPEEPHQALDTNEEDE